MNISRVQKCKGKRAIKTEEEADKIRLIMEERYRQPFVYYWHLDHHYHVAHADPMNYSALTNEKYCQTCRRRYHSKTYEEHVEKKYHQAVVRKHGEYRALLDK